MHRKDIIKLACEVVGNSNIEEKEQRYYFMEGVIAMAEVMINMYCNSGDTPSDTDMIMAHHDYIYEPVRAYAYSKSTK